MRLMGYNQPRFFSLKLDHYLGELPMISSIDFGKNESILNAEIGKKEIYLIGLPPIVVPKRELVNADFRHENLCYCLAVS